MENTDTAFDDFGEPSLARRPGLRSGRRPRSHKIEGAQEPDSMAAGGPHECEKPNESAPARQAADPPHQSVRQPLGGQDGGFQKSARTEGQPAGNATEQREGLTRRLPARRPGRPELSLRERKDNEDRRYIFASLLRHLRNSIGLSITELGREAGMSNCNQARTYETKCYPPGKVLNRYAEIFGISRKDLALACLAMSDPDLYAAVAGTDEEPPMIFEIRQMMALDESE